MTEDVNSSHALTKDLYYAKEAFRNNLFIFIVVRLGGWPQRKKAHVQF